MKQKIKRYRGNNHGFFSLVDAIGFGLREEIKYYAKRYNKTGTREMKSKLCICLIDLFFHPFFSSVFDKPEDVLQFANQFIDKREKISVDDLEDFDDYRICPIGDSRRKVTVIWVGKDKKADDRAGIL